MSDPKVFALSMRELADRYKRDLAAVVTQAVQTLGERVVVRTPVDTGYARNAWWSGVDGQPSSNPVPPTKGQRGVPNSAGGTQDLQPESFVNAPGRVWNLRNSAAYIGRLEYGYSAKAPEGMVRRTVAEWASIVEEAARQVGAAP